MRQCFSLRHALAAAAGMACLAASGTALAQDEPGWRDGRWQGSPSDYRPAGRPPHHDEAPREAYVAAPLANPGQEAWLADCRQRVSARDRGLGGAAIGGLVGGVAGNRIAGRGNRTVGTLAGAAVGAAAGVVIDKAEDAGRTRDECKAYLDDYYARYQAQDDRGVYGMAANAPTYGQGYGYPQGYAYGCCGAVPVMMVPAPVQAQPECTETIEYVYEDVPVQRRSYRPARRTKIVRDKRVKLSVK